MDDESLAVFLGLNAKDAAKYIPTLSPEKRSVFERMAEVVIDLEMGVVPDGVIACNPKGCRHG
jgi:hypothetical protein